MAGGHGLILDVVAHGGEQPAFVAELAEHVVEQRGDGRLAVRARDAHKFHLRRRVAVEQRCHLSHGIFGALHLHEGDTGRLFGQILAQDGARSLLNGLADEAVTVHLRPFHGHEQVSVGNLPTVYIDARDVHIVAADDLQGLDILQ